MITDALINLGIGIMTVINEIFPNADSNVTAFLANGTTAFNDLLQYGSTFIPVGNVMFVLWIIIVIESVILTVRSVLWIASFVIPWLKNNI